MLLLMAVGVAIHFVYFSASQNLQASIHFVAKARFHVLKYLVLTDTIGRSIDDHVELPTFSFPYCLPTRINTIIHQENEAKIALDESHHAVSGYR